MRSASNSDSVRRDSGTCNKPILLTALLIGSLVALGVALYLTITWWHSNALLLGPRPRSTARELSLAEAEQTLGKIVVPIGGQPKSWAGSAVAVRPRRLLSVCHVGKDNLVTMVEGQVVRLRLLAERLSSDECLFATDRRLPRVVSGVRTVSSLITLEPVYAFGYPSGTPALSLGLFVDVIIDDTGRREIRSTAPVASGDSGGGLFDRFGNLIGIVRAHYGEKAALPCRSKTGGKSDSTLALSDRPARSTASANTKTCCRTMTGPQRGRLA